MEKNAADRKKQYKDLLKVTRIVITSAQEAISTVRSYKGENLMDPVYAMGIANELQRYIPLA